MLPLRMLGLLLLMSSLCDADSTCPTELNPLSLDPPEFITKNGTSVTVNCTSIDEIHDGMYWRDENEDVEEDLNFISKTVEVLDWNVEVQCKIKLNETIECSKDLKITVYKDPDGIFLYPITYVKAAVEHSPYDLQCDITNVAPVQNLIVRWYKDNEIIKTNSFTNTTKIPVSESSVLTVNISRGDDGAQFRCEAQLDFGPHGPQCPNISSGTQNVSVHYAPEFKNKTGIDDVYVEEGDNVTLNCEADGNPPPVFHWTKDRVNIPENTNNLYINRAITSATYSCTATNYLGNVTKQINVHVTRTTIAKTTPEPLAINKDCPLTLTPAELVVRFGDPASVNCSTSATHVLGIGWEATVGGKAFEEHLDATWSVDKLDVWVMEPKCYITLEKNDRQCTVMPVITIYKTPDSVSISASANGTMVEGTEYQLTCNIINVAPVRKLVVKWYRGNEILHTDKFSNSSVMPMNVSSNLRVTPERDHDGAHFRCEAELHLGPKGPEPVPTTSSASYIAVVGYKPLIQSCPGIYTGVEYKFSMEKVPCQFSGNPRPTVVWLKQGIKISPSKPLNRNDSGVYIVEVENDYGKTNSSVNITVEYSPSFSCNDHYAVENGSSPIPCKPEGIPEPAITWFKDGKEVTLPSHWRTNDSGKYFLRATNKHGEANHTLNLDVLYAPVFKVGVYNKEVTLGENVTFECSAEGNPPPKINWKYKSAVNVQKTTWGCQNCIYIIGATSTNAGVYNCTATNKVGNVTRSFTLTIKAVTFHLPLWSLVILICIAIAIAIIIILMICFKCMRQHGQYSFVPDKTNDGLDIPMSTTSAGRKV